MARLGVETAGRAFSSINTTMVAIYCERYSLQSPWELVGRSAWSARIGSRALFPSDRNKGGKGVKPYAHSSHTVNISLDLEHLRFKIGRSNPPFYSVQLVRLYA